MENMNIFGGGIPTAPDVKKLREKFPDDFLVSGAVIHYNEVEREIQSKHGTHRFNAVTRQWRKEVERDLGKIIGCVNGVGFKVLDAHGTLKLSKDKLHTGIKAVGRSIVVSRHIDVRGLDESGKKQLERLQRRQAGIAEVAQIRTKIQLPSLLAE